jgi:hypothetical protein
MHFLRGGIIANRLIHLKSSLTLSDCRIHYQNAEAKLAKITIASYNPPGLKTQLRYLLDATLATVQRHFDTKMS